MLLENSNEMTESGQCVSLATAAIPCVGYDEWLAGTADTFAGVHLVDDMTYLPHRQGRGAALPLRHHLRLALRPRPLACHRPRLRRGGHRRTAPTITGDFTADLLKETINNTETGYRRTIPRSPAAPICSTASMRAGQQATLKANPEFRGVTTAA